MESQKIIEELESLRVRMGRHMLALDSMNPVEQSNAFLCDLERMKQISRELDAIAK